MKRICKCGHTQGEHTVTAGPNSIGQWQHNLCGHGATIVRTYVLTKCHCVGFKSSLTKTIRALGSK